MIENLRMDKRKKNSVIICYRSLFDISLIYIFIPILVMIIGWTKIVFAIPIVLLIIVSVLLSRKRVNKEGSFCISLRALIIIGIIAIFIGILSGWGGLLPQSGDWNKHNALFRDLVTKSWPVFYNNNGVESMLTYYMAQYMVPSIAGKIVLAFNSGAQTTAFVAAEITMLIWNSLGLYLILIYVSSIIGNSKAIISSVCFILFGSLLPIGRLILSIAYDNRIDVIRDGFQHNLDTGLIEAQYTTNFVQLRWVFPQCIVPWLVVAILLTGIVVKDNYVVIGLPIVLFASFPFIGILPFMINDAVRELCKTKKFVNWVKELFSIQNVLMIISLGTFEALYFYGYIFTSDKPAFLKFSINNFTIPSYILFLLSSFGIYAFLIILVLKKGLVDFDKLYLWTSIAILIILPLYRMGAANDFTMRVSIPALFVICIAFIKILLSENVQKIKPFWVIVIFAFLIGTIYPIMEMETVVAGNDFFNHQELADKFESLEYYANPDLETIDPYRFYQNEGYMDILYNYYSYGNSMRYFTETIGKNN